MSPPKLGPRAAMDQLDETKISSKPRPIFFRLQKPRGLGKKEINEGINQQCSANQFQNQSDHLAIEINKGINKLSPSERCICRVPETLARSNMDAYKPRLVPIGPFHHDPQKFKDMEKQKLRYLDAFLARTELSRDTYTEAVKKMEGKARSCYAETIELDSNELVKMFLVDACFVIELFLRIFVDKERDKLDLFISVPVLRNDLCNDLKLLENQLPFFVLQGIYDLPQKHLPYSLRKLTFRFFEYHNVQNKEAEGDFEIRHFTDLLRTFLLPKLRLEHEEGDGTKFKSVPSATELDEAGAKFKINSSAQCLFDIRFKNGRILKIPRLLIGDETEAFFRNIVAYEQCHYYPDEFFVSNYIALMGCLVKTNKDVNLLVEEGILVNLIGDNKVVSRLFQNVNEGVVIGLSKLHYQQLCDDLNAYGKMPWNRLKASLKRDYFKTPWMGAATVAAILVLLLTCTQTICSIIALT